MAKIRIKIKDLPKDMKISKEEMKKITGGTLQEQFQGESAMFHIPSVTDQVTTSSSTLAGFADALTAANAKLSEAEASLGTAATRDTAATKDTSEATKPY